MKYVKRGLLVILACLACLACVLLFAVRPFYNSRAENVLTAENYTITINGMDLKEIVSLSDGQIVDIYLDWKLKNTADTSQNTFILNIDEQIKSKNIAIFEYPEAPLPDMNDSNKSIGTYKIENGVMTIVLNKEYMESVSERSGYAKFQGQVKVDEGTVDDNGKVTIQIGEKTYTIDYNVPQTPESGLNISKTKVDGRAHYKGTFPDGKIVQGYQVAVTAYTGDVKQIQLTDQVADATALFDMGNIVITDSTVSGIAKGNTYSSLDELNGVLSSVTMHANESFSFAYDMTMSNHYLETNTGGYNYSNTIIADYRTNKDQTGEASDPEPAWFYRPEVTKSGTLSEDGKQVIWTIQLHLNDLYTKGRNLSEIIESVQDKPDNNYFSDGIRNLNLADAELISESEGIYQWTVTTNVTDGVLEGTADKTLKNTVDVTFKGGWKLSADGTVGVPGQNWLSKKAGNYDSANKVISWEVTMSDIPAGVTSVYLKDVPNIWWPGRQEFYGDITISVDGGTPVTIWQADSDSPVIGDIIESGSKDNNGWSGCELYFKDQWIQEQQGKTVVINYQTQVKSTGVTDGAYQNTAYLTYTENGNTVTKNATAEKKFEDNAIVKTGVANSQSTGVDYTISVDLDKISGLEAGKEIVLTDTLPDTLNLVTASAVGSMKKVYNRWYSVDWNDIEVPVTTSVTGNQAEFRISVTQQFLDAIAAAENESYTAGIALKYQTVVKDLKNFTETKTFTNSVTGTYSGTTPIGEYSVSNDVTPVSHVNKSGKYNLETAPNVEYTIKVNPNAIQLAADGETLSGKDTLGPALRYNLNTIKIRKKLADNTWVEMTEGADYTYTYNSAENSLTFANLPDATYLEITYSARVVLYTDTKDASNNDTLTSDNSSNDFVLSGAQSGNTKANTALNEKAITPMVAARSETGTVIVKKVDEANPAKVITDSACTFRLVECDIVNGELQEGTARDTISIDASGEALFVNLQYDKVFALYEVKAPEGYIKRTDPYYFILKGSSYAEVAAKFDTLPAGTQIKTLDAISERGPLTYELPPYTNKAIPVEQDGRLVITKTIKGGITPEEAAGALVFNVRKSTDAEGTGTNYTLQNDFVPKSYDADTSIIKYQMELPVVSGGYIITETKYDVDGYTLKKVSYSVGGTENDITSDKQTGEITVLSGEETDVDLVDVYERDKGKLILEKHMNGMLSKEEARKNISFTIADENGKTVKKIALSDASFMKSYPAPATDSFRSPEIELPTGVYTVTETTKDVDGYTLNPVLYTVTVEGEESRNGIGNKTAAALKKDVTTTVTFVNTYIAAPVEGILIITKTIEGEVLEEEAKGALKFKVTNRSSGASETLTLAQFDSDGNGHYTYRLPLMGGGYTVEETVSAIAGHTLKSIQYSVGDGEYQEADKASTAPVDVTVNAGLTTNVNYKDIYDTYGMLRITKTIEGPVTSPEACGALQFVVTNDTTQETDTYSLSQFGYDPEKQQYYMELPKIVGSYTVEEKVTAITGHELSSVQYTINTNQSYTDGKIAKVTVKGNKTAIVSYKNVYDNDSNEPTPQPQESDSPQDSEAPLGTQPAGASAYPTATNPASVNPTGIHPAVTQTVMPSNHPSGTQTAQPMKAPTETSAVVNTKAPTQTKETGSTKVPVGTKASESTKVPTQTKVAGSTKVPTQTKSAGSTKVPAQTKSAGSTKIPTQTKTAASTKTPSGTESVKATKMPSGTESVKATKTPSGTEIVKVTEKPSSTKKSTGTDLPKASKTPLGTKSPESIKEPIVSEKASVTPSGTATPKNIKVSVGPITTGIPFGGSNNDDSGASPQPTVDSHIFSIRTVLPNAPFDPDRGKLVIKKRIDGPVTRSEIESALKFEVTNSDTAETVTYTLKDFTYDETDGTYILELECISGNYIVRETETDVNGYVTVSVQYSFDGGTTYEDGGYGKLQVLNGEISNIEFKDSYMVDVGSTQQPKDEEKTDGNENHNKVVLSKIEKVLKGSDNSENSTAAQTGDETPITALAVAAVLSGAILLTCGSRKRRKFQKFEK